jgi:D-aminopeptidase
VRPREVLPLEGYWRLPPGERNALTDVQGVRVGHLTRWADEPYVERTGVTVVVPPAEFPEERLPAAVHVFNGTGEMTGVLQVEEWGYLETPIGLTGTRGVGAVWEGVQRYCYRRSQAVGRRQAPALPVVAECNDMFLHDTRGAGIDPEAVADLLAAVPEEQTAWGAVGAGTGMTAFGLKGGVGTASRLVEVGGESFVLGALTLVNFGQPGDLVIAGRAVGHLPGEIERRTVPPEVLPDGSLVAVLATDAPLDASALRRVARRAPLGMARVGGYGRHYSGDLFLAFSTAGKVRAAVDDPWLREARIRPDAIDPFLRAAVEAVEEAILHALVAAETTSGRLGRVVSALPLAAVRSRL